MCFLSRIVAIIFSKRLYQFACIVNLQIITQIDRDFGFLGHVHMGIL